MALVLSALNTNQSLEKKIMQPLFDRIAIILSSICVIHCIALPIIASLTPLFAVTLHHGNNLHEFWFHYFILIFILPFSILAIILGYRHHRQILPAVIAAVGLSILVFTSIFAGTLISNQIIPHEGETWLTLSGGIVHAIGHIMNLVATSNLRLSCANQ